MGSSTLHLIPKMFGIQRYVRQFSLKRIFCFKFRILFPSITNYMISVIEYKKVKNS